MKPRYCQPNVASSAVEIGGWKRLRSLLALLATVFVAVFAGCGTGDYERLMDRRASDLRRGAKFIGLCAPSAVPNSRFTIETPNIFKKIDNHPTPFIPLPGFVPFQNEEIYEETNRASYYLFFASMPTAPRLDAILAAKVKAALPKSAPAWETIEVDSPSLDEKIAWEVMRVEGELLFDAVVKGHAEVQRFPGHAEIWMYRGPQVSLVLVWQVPKALEDKVKLLHYAPITAGTLKILPDPPAPAPPAAKPAA